MTEVIQTQELKTLIERIERLEEDKSNVQMDIKEVYSEAKSLGFDTKIIKRVIKLRKMDAASREEEKSLVEIYSDALGI